MLARLINRNLVVPMLLGLGILATLGREIVFANYLGTSRDLEVFRLAFALPNLLSQSLAPAYIGALLPLLVAAQRGSTEDYRAFCRRLARISVGGIVLITAIGMISVSWQSALLAPGFDEKSLNNLSDALAVCWLFFLLTGVSFLPRLFLNKRHEFWPGVSTSLIISTTLVFVCIGASTGPNAVTGKSLSLAAVLAGGMILALHLMREPRPVGLLFGIRHSSTTPGSQADSPILRPLFLVLLIHVANAIPRFIDRAFASEFPQGIVAALEYSYNIITVPGILLGTSIITIYYPAFVRRVQDESQPVFHRTLVQPALISVAVAFIVGLGLYIFSVDIIALVYGRGAFDDDAIESTATLLGWHGLGLGFMVAALILSQACLAFGVFRALLLIAVIRIVSKSTAILWLVPRFDLDGLGASFIVPEAVSTLLLLALLLIRSRPRM